MLILYLIMMLMIRRLLKTPRSSEISSVVEEPLVNPDAPIIDESYVSSADISDIVDA